MWMGLYGNRLKERPWLIPHPFREGSITDCILQLTQQGYSEEYPEHRGKGSFPAMITPAYQNAKKANELASDVSTTLGRPMKPQKQRRNETLKARLTETYTQINLLELSQNRLLALNFYPKRHLLLLFGLLCHIYLLPRRLTGTNYITHLRSIEASTDVGPAR